MWLREQLYIKLGFFNKNRLYILPEKCRNMMVFQDSSVIIESSQTAAWIDVKVVGGARMVEIVDNGCHQGREDFQVGHPILKYIVYRG